MIYMQIPEGDTGIPDWLCPSFFYCICIQVLTWYKIVTWNNIIINGLSFCFPLNQDMTRNLSNVMDRTN